MGLTDDAGRVYSVCPYHGIRSLVEELSAFFNVLMVSGSGAFGTGSKQGEALFGQCLLISRSHYDAVGGHGSVRSEVLENFQLAGRLEELGIDSMGGVKSIFAIEETFDISVPFNANNPQESDFDISTVATIVQGIERLRAEQG